MTEACARSVLRLMAVAIIMIGLSMAVYALVGLMGASQAMSGVQALGVSLPGTISRLAIVSLLANLAVSGLGFGLFALSPSLAAKVVS